MAAAKEIEGSDVGPFIQCASTEQGRVIHKATLSGWFVFGTFRHDVCTYIQF